MGKRSILNGARFTFEKVAHTKLIQEKNYKILKSYTTHFTVCTFNLFNYIEPPNAFYDSENIYSASQWQKKEKWINQQLTDLSPDIIGFQEVFSPKALKSLAASHGLSHFVTVSDPSVRSQHVYDKPVVALASRFPILSARAVDVARPIVHSLSMQSKFSFSRPPIRAEIQINDFATILVYVVHLKSKRSQLESVEATGNDEDTQIAESLLAEIHGSWASSIQRGTEATLLYHDIVQQTKASERPVIVLGDLNDTIDSAPLQSLVGSEKLDRLDGKTISELPLSARRSIQRYLLQDAFEMQDEIPLKDRKPTHYFANRGNVLDYILLSKDFKNDLDHSLASVSKYRVNDGHLINPHHVDDAECSDHAPVMIEVEIRS